MFLSFLTCKLNSKRVSSTVQLHVHAQSLLTCCDPMDYSPPVSSVYRILQVRIPEKVVMLSSRGLPDPGIEPRSSAFLALHVDSLSTEPHDKPMLKVLRKSIDIRFLDQYMTWVKCSFTVSCHYPLICAKF